MKAMTFFKDKFIFITLNFFIAGFSAFLLYMVDANLYFILFIPCVYLSGSILSLLPEYLTKSRYYREIQNSIDSLDKKYFISEIIERPNFYEGKILYDFIKAANKSMRDEIAKYGTSSAEYREYIEMWVHEIKTPIAAAKLVCENTENESISAELEKIDKFVEQALFYSRSNNVEKDYIIKQVKLNEIINRVLRKNAKYLIAKKIKVQTVELEQTVLTDNKWTDFILQQIIDNSIKYGCSSIKIYSEQNENNISLFICDNGIGIPQQDIKRVFDKGFTGENGRRFIKSTGIGLYLCKKLCMKLGLDILIRSNAGNGTNVEIIFPKSNMYV